MLNPSSFWNNFFGFLRRFIDATPPVLPPAPSEEEEILEVVDGWPLFDGPPGEVPSGRREMVKTYGEPHVTYTKTGTARVSKEFGRRLHTIPAALLPGYHRPIYMHRLVSGRFREALRRSRILAPSYEFKRIGCFNPRHMRHNKSMPLSDHTWGIAFDINASTNRAFYRKEKDPLPFEEGWESFSDLPIEIVEIFEGLGFSWGGRWGNKKPGFCDPMHFSLRK
jgi:hypothetical protein